VASLVGGSIAVFFATKELSLFLHWSETNTQTGIQAISFEGLDFLFIIAFVIGLYSMHRLYLVSEEGEVTERVVITELTAEVMQQMKSVSTVGGLRQLTSFPLYIARDSLRKLSRTNNKRREK
jgi:hypothetical protein